MKLLKPYPTLALGIILGVIVVPKVRGRLGI